MNELLRRCAAVQFESQVEHRILLSHWIFFGIGIGAWMTKVCSHHTTVHRRRVVFIKSTGAAAMKTWLSSSLGFYASQVHKISRTPATTRKFSTCSHKNEIGGTKNPPLILTFSAAAPSLTIVFSRYCNALDAMIRLKQFLPSSYSFCHLHFQ